MAKKSKTEKNSAESEVSKKFKQNPGLYIGSVIILVIITIAFLGGELISPGGFTQDAVFGYYDKVPIRWLSNNIFDRHRATLTDQFQRFGELNSWTMAYIWDQAYSATIVHNAILQIMKRSNYSIPEKTVDIRVSRLPEFQENGAFSPVRYNRLTATQRANLWQEIHDDIVKGVFLDDILDGLLLTNAEAEFIGNLATPQRSFNMVLFNINNYTDEELMSFAEENSSLFDSLHLSKIVFSGEREANRVFGSINSGATSFDEAARTQSQTTLAERGGDMGVKFIYELEREIPSQDRPVVFNLRAGEVSHIIRTDEGWVIYKAEDEIKKADFNDDNLLQTVRFYIRESAPGRMVDWATARARNFVLNANESSFEEAARSMDLQVRNFGPFPINYAGNDLFPRVQDFPISGMSENEINDLSRNEIFWKNAFSTPVNMSSEPFVQGNNVVVLSPVEEIDDPDTASLAASAYLSYWLYSLTERSLLQYFRNNPRMDDRFNETYGKLMQ